VTVDSEQRLGQTLLQLARTMGKKDPRSIRIELRISHEELSEMVGTTRPRISMFMQRFHNLGLIETNREHLLIIKERNSPILYSDRLVQRMSVSRGGTPKLYLSNRCGLLESRVVLSLVLCA
jgi:CRP/FNR family transcriptional regulator, cyclic AMP receptor protein